MTANVVEANADKKLPANRYTPNISLYHSGTIPAIQSKAIRVTMNANSTMKRGAKRLARTLNWGSLLLSCRIEPRTRIDRAIKLRHRIRTVRAEKNGRLSQNALPAKILL